ncbi:hypothetical protein [Clostridium algidicarnis]|uniref:BtrH N-terminal domain-containing protein n=1 Tax=Clostridium algidicarnis TaxID=37659 RepID=A0ABS6C1X4_9CLOT|nr:hypothetical protein [Clostridium algidicarnis]MBB6631394.1 hypothetical protein [Clostridium algidicarnis]MBB6697128.1 hypothetical protein [Clostridium algidicarnis]MBU3219483.1 BtrH N-terminal domain-containing protein [Clostridium algidicarnis]MCB2287035.1 BtrH N-terminal domain-containing protein [Clostridium algidicarnis]
MLNKKLINGIEPFNEVFYKDCFYNSLFPVIKYFKRDVLSFLINDVAVYKEDNKIGNLNFDADYTSIYSFERLCCAESLIKLECKKKSDDLIKDIIDSILKERPVIVFIDCYYEKIRPEMHGKVHWFHTVTVFGYDMDNKTFDIIEHRHKDNLGYEKRKIGFTELINCNEGYIRNFSEQLKRDSYYSFYLDESLEDSYQLQDNNILSSLFKSNVLLNKEEIINGINRLQFFSKRFEEVVNNEVSLRKNTQDLVNVISNIINCKRVERYKLEKLLPTEYEMINLMDIVIEEWSSIRKIIGKYLFSGIYKPNDIKNAIISINEIVDFENLYILKF